MKNTEQNDYGQQDLNNLLEKEISNNGGESTEDPNCVGADGMTMFDTPNSQDDLITVLLPKKTFAMSEHTQWWKLEVVAKKMVVMVEYIEE